MCIVGFIMTGNFIGFSRQYTKTRRKTLRLCTTDSLWGETNREQWNLHTKGQQREKLYFCNSSFSRLHMMERHILHNSGNICTLGFHLTGNCIVYSAKHTDKMQENIKILRYWSFLRRTHLWPMDSPHKGPAMREALTMQFQDYMSSFVSSILCKIKQCFHNSVITCASWV